MMAEMMPADTVGPVVNQTGTGTEGIVAVTTPGGETMTTTVIGIATTIAADATGPALGHQATAAAAHIAIGDATPAASRLVDHATQTGPGTEAIRIETRIGIGIGTGIGTLSAGAVAKTVIMATGETALVLTTAAAPIPHGAAQAPA